MCQAAHSTSTLHITDIRLKCTQLMLRDVVFSHPACHSSAARLYAELSTCQQRSIAALKSRKLLDFNSQNQLPSMTSGFRSTAAHVHADVSHNRSHICHQARISSKHHRQAALSTSSKRPRQYTMHHPDVTHASLSVATPGTRFSCSRKAWSVIIPPVFGISIFSTAVALVFVLNPG